MDAAKFQPGGETLPTWLLVRGTEGWPSASGRWGFESMVGYKGGEVREEEASVSLPLHVLPDSNAEEVLRKPVGRREEKRRKRNSK
jgi:hypothetical protein